ncbi:MAG: FadR family transcriptional regulator [Actinobacteria bacterium]|nr:FadR family transcriptional regulator [Actinomycetota bacterium]
MSLQLPQTGNAVQRTRKTAEVVAREIVRDIVERKLETGDMLPGEQAMLVRYGVGRPALREALRVLEVHDLLHLKPGPGGGPVIGTVSARAFGEMASLFFRLAGATFRELLEARLDLEPLASRLAAQHRGGAGVSALRQVADRAAAVDVADDEGYAGVAHDFHAALTDACGNRVVSLIGGGLLELCRDRIPVPITPRRERPAVLRMHRMIIAAIETGDVGRAEGLTNDLLDDLLGRLRLYAPDVLDDVVDWA